MFQTKTSSEKGGMRLSFFCLFVCFEIVCFVPLLLLTVMLLLFWWWLMLLIGLIFLYVLVF